MLGGVSGFLGDADGAGDRFQRDAALGNAFGEFNQQQGILAVLFQRERERLGEGKPADLGFAFVQKAQAPAALFRIFGGGEHGLQVERQGLAGALDGQVHGLVFGFLQALDHRFNRVDRLAVERDDLVVLVESGFLGGGAALHGANYDGRFRIPACRPDFVGRDGYRHDGSLNDLAPALDGNAERLLGAEPHARLQLFPSGVFESGISGVFHFDDAVAGQQAGFRCGRILLNALDHRRLGKISVGLVRQNIDDGEQRDREQNVHHRAGNGDKKAVPARMVHELGGIVGVLVHRIFAAHLHIAAERDGGDAVIGVAAAETDEALAEADGKHLDAHAQPLGHGIVAELVDEDHEPENYNHRDNGN